MEKKEFYRHALPHFQQPGQAYFVTWSLIDAIPPNALVEYTDKLHLLYLRIKQANDKNGDFLLLNSLKSEFNLTRRKYLKAFDDLLHEQKISIVNLSKEANRTILINALTFLEGKKLENYAFCIMSNHVHWVLWVYDTDENGNQVYLQDILQSVKRSSATLINKIEGISGALWQKESYDTTIRDDNHLYNAIDYTINNPVKAGLVTNWYEWKGTRLFNDTSEILKPV